MSFFVFVFLILSSKSPHYSALDPSIIHLESRSIIDIFLTKISFQLENLFIAGLISLPLSAFINSITAFFWGGSLGMVGLGFFYEFKEEKSFIKIFLALLINRFEIFWGFYSFWLFAFRIKDRQLGEKLLGLELNLNQFSVG